MCEVAEHNGFLKNVCKRRDTVVYKCVHSDVFYSYLAVDRKEYIHSDITETLWTYDKICDEDPNFYQMCGFANQQLAKRGVQHSGLESTLCNDLLCQSKSKKGALWNAAIKTMQALTRAGNICNQKQDCKNTNLDEAGCTEFVNSRGYSPGPTSAVAYKGADLCNNKLSISIFDEEYYFDDESECNGFTYGAICGDWDNRYYVPPIEICDGYDYVDNFKWGYSKSTVCQYDCSATKKLEFTCIHRKSGQLVPLFNFTRCAAFQLDDSYADFQYDGKNHTFQHKKNTPPQYFSYCADFLDQTNCTDPQRIGMKCRVRGYLSTVSSMKICVGNPVCDDGLDTDCRTVSPVCHAHKHQLCDNHDDCADRSDEILRMCKATTKKGCKRMTGKASELPLPLSWLHDGVEDCLDGSDEKEGWLTCGVGRTSRFVGDNSSCDNVLLSRREDQSYVTLEQLCDGRETRGNEQKMCDKAHERMSLSKEVLTTNRGISKHLSFCIKGLSSIQNQVYSCTNTGFIFPDHKFFGVERTTIHLPNTTQNCSHLYGEQYVYTSCTERCGNSSCPLTNIPKYESCPTQYPNRVGTLVNNEYITFFKKSFYNVYVNNFFVCSNKVKCVDYAQVCDLVDDCGDGSDEEHCTNHFQCRDNNGSSTGQYIPVTKQCDGKIDCLDQSDECNEKCTRRILDNIHIRRLSWIIGMSSVTANTVMIVRTAISLKQSRTSVALINKSLILGISTGDLLVGSYLLGITVLDAAIYGTTYCLKQPSWLTSLSCSILGVLSTLGSQISLLSMTGLSIVRVHGIWNSMRVPGEINIRRVLLISLGMMLILISSVSIATIPIVQVFKDFFVNGIHYEAAMKLFVGFPGKERHFRVLEQYYGRMKNRTLTWDQIDDMVGRMFSHLTTPRQKRYCTSMGTTESASSNIL